jgi:hypothetical protein
MKSWILSLCTAFTLSWIAWVRTDGFSPALIEAAYPEERMSAPVSEVQSLLMQPFYYLSKGRQSFVFQSQDGQVVLKFFNRKYLEMPWYGFLWEKKERAKRSLRRFFYENSYPIALQEFGEEILYLHLRSSDTLPVLSIVDQASRSYEVDLNKVSFVLQRKGDSFFPRLEEIYQTQGLEGLYQQIDSFVAAVGQRISRQIADADTDVGNNWGYVEGRLFHLDPGRLYYDPTLKNPERIQREWHNATRGLHKWLKIHHPEAADYLFNKLN